MSKIKMNVSGWVKQLSLNPFLLATVRILHVGNFLKYFYFNVVGPKNGEKILCYDRISARLHVTAFENLRYLEAVFEKGDKDESSMLAPILEKLQPGDVAYDVGAHIGIYTVFMAEKVGGKGRIVAFEPEMKNYEALIVNIRLNGFSNCIAVNVALGDKQEKGRLYVKKRIGTGATSLINGGESSELFQIVEVVPGDVLVETKNLPIPKVVKIDVEGYEYHVINGLQKTLSQETCELVCCEIHSNLFPPGANAKTILDLLRFLGFRQIKTYARGGEIHATCYRYE